MRLNQLLDQGTLLEETISSCYECLAQVCPDSAVAWRLRKMAREEKNHANILRSGKSYLKMVPSAFGVEIMTAGEIKAGLGLAQDLLRTLSETGDFAAGLSMLLELERRFEKVHLDTSVEIKDPSLKKLFHDLSLEDKSHIQSLEEIIAASPSP
jgi:rubrerythrin